jgi:hypothetical protein
MRYVILVLGICWVASAQTCVQQPPPELDRISEWSCKDMSFEQAWDLLAANQIAPVRYAKITELGNKANYNSKKQKLLRGLQIIGFGTGLIGGMLANSGDLLDWQIGALIAGPKVTEAGITFFSGRPDQFRETPNEAGFTTIYSLYSNQLIAGPVPAMPKPAVEPTPGFVPTTWFALYRETRPDTRLLRQSEIAWRAEWAIQDAEARMNFHEAQLLAGAR